MPDTKAPGPIIDGMTVRELIAELQTCNPDLPVVAWCETRWSYFSISLVETLPDGWPGDECDRRGQKMNFPVVRLTF